MQDRSYTVPELFSWLQAAGLHFTALNGPSEKFRLSLQDLFLSQEVEPGLQRSLTRLRTPGNAQMQDTLS